jgi:hypothetical protein
VSPAISASEMSILCSIGVVGCFNRSGAAHAVSYQRVRHSCLPCYQ